MFTNIKSSFGTPSSNTSFGFPSNVTSNPFGQSTFGKPATPGFGAPSTAFGAGNTTLFGSTSQHGSPFASGAPTATFGQPAQTQPTFGSSMFGAPSAQPSGSGLFGSTNTSAFGQQNKPTGFGFGASTGSTGFFGQTANPVQPQQPTAGIFGQSTPNLFGNPSGFGSGVGNVQLGTVIKFTPVTSTDTMVKGTLNQTISTRHHCITCMKEYENKSLEELRWEDYQANRKGPQQGSQPATGLFSSMAQPTQNLFGTGAVATAGNSLFGQTDSKSVFGGSAQPTFGQPNTAFGTVPSSNSSVLFGKPMTGFGAAPSNTSTFAFNSNPQPTNLFGSNTAAKSFSTTSQPNNMFGQSTSGFGTQSTFGSFGTNTNQNVGLFNQNKPAFNMGQTTSNAFAGFGQPSTQNTSLFPGTKTTTGFAGFGNTTAPSLFGQSTFGQTNQNLFGSSFNKPAPSLFGQTNTSNTLGMMGTGTPLFGSTANKPPSMFSNNLGMFNSGFGTTNMNTSFGMNGMNMQPGVPNVDPNQINMEQQILSMSSTPYGITKLLNNVPEVSNDLKDMTRPTNPSELNALLNTVKKSPCEAPLDKLEPVHVLGRKLPMFDGLEKKDDNLVTNFRISTNPKRLMLRLRNGDNETVPVRANTSWTDSDFFTKEVENKFPSEYSAIPTANTSKGLSESNKEINNSISLSACESLNEVPSPALNDTSNVSIMQNEDEIDDDQESFSEARDSVEWQEDKSKTTEDDEAKSDSPKKTTPEPHPTGIVLTRLEYYTIPSMDDLIKFVSPDGSCVVKGFTVGRFGYGNVYFPDTFDVSNLDLDEIVHIRHKEINIYPDDSKKPPQGQGLNRRAQVTLDNVWPYDKNLKMLITDIDILNKRDYAARLRRLCEKQNTRFVEYRPETGSWVFKVEHFSKYGHRDSDDSDEEILPNIPIDSKEKPIMDPKQPTPINGTCLVNGVLQNSSNVSTVPQEAVGLSASFYEPLLNFNTRDSMELLEVPNLSQNLPQLTTNHFQMMKRTFFNDMDVSADLDIDHQVNGFNHSKELRSLQSKKFKYQIGSDSNIDVENGFVGMLKDKSPQRPESPQRPDMLIDDDDDEDAIADQTFTNSFDVDEMSFFDDTSDNIELVEEETIPYGVIPFDITGFGQSDFADAIMFKGRSFKVGWGKDLNFILLTSRENANVETRTLDTILQGRNRKDYSPSILQVVSLQDLSMSGEYLFKDQLESFLKNQLLASEYSIQHGVPHFKSSFGFDLLDHHQQSLQNESKTDYLRQIWDLCHALWGKLDETDLQHYTKTHLRRKHLSTWLQHVVTDEVDKNLHNSGEEKTFAVIVKDIFTYVSGNKLEEAAVTAFNSNNCYLSMLLPLLSTNLETKSLFNKQLEEWKTSSTCNHINKTILKLYMLLAGRPHMKFNNQWIYVFEDLDWVRTMAIFLWYVVDSAHPLKDAIQMYEETFLTDVCAKPVPFYLDETENIYDLRFQLLKFYSDTSHSLEKVLDPITYTDDPLDYRLSWLLLQALSSFGYHDILSQTRLHINMNFAAQLERLGYWHWSVFVLLFIEDPYIREQSVKNVLERHIKILNNMTPEYVKQEQMLVQQFRVPSEWIDCAKSAMAVLHGKYAESYFYMTFSKQWALGHEMLKEILLPDHLLCGDYEFVIRLLNSLSKHSKKIPNWRDYGGLILDFAKLCDLFKDTDESTDRHKLMMNVTRFRAGIRKIIRTRNIEFPTPHDIYNICMADMYSRMSVMLTNVLRLVNGKKHGDGRSSSAIDIIHLPESSEYIKHELTTVLRDFSVFAGLNGH